VRPVHAGIAKLKRPTKTPPKGFEIIGISLDRDKSALERVVAREQLTWPQAFDNDDDAQNSPKHSHYEHSHDVAGGQERGPP